MLERASRQEVDGASKEVYTGDWVVRRMRDNQKNPKKKQ
jgi:hypothetical protein